MRGDSRRDLYSKTLALCGLGVLAGAGALVDYWPVGVRFPLAALPLSAPAVFETTSMTPDEALVAASRLIDAPRAVAVAAAVPDEPERLARLAVSRTFESMPVAAVGFDIGAALDILEPPIPAFVNVRHEVPVLPGVPVRLVAPGPDRLDRAFPASVSNDTDDGDWFLTTAFRKTGSSIVKGGVRTGTSLVDAVRVVGSMVRRALPN